MSQPQRAHRREIWASVCIGYDVVSDILWRAAMAAGQHVGTCGRLNTTGVACGQPLRPGEPYEQGPVWWYPAACALGHETAAHGARPEKAKKGGA
jgi:hypothetical protein